MTMTARNETAVKPAPRNRAKHYSSYQGFLVQPPFLFRCLPPAAVSPAVEKMPPRPRPFEALVALAKEAEAAAAESTPSHSSSSSSFQSTPITHLRTYHLFPLPNSASKASDYTQYEKDAIDEFWLRTLTTGLHSEEELEQIERMANEHGY